METHPTTILVTGAAGFVGYHVSNRLLESGHAVVGVDNLNDYYDPTLKQARLAQLEPFDRFRFVKLDVADRERVAAIFESSHPAKVVHLAAQAGVRYSRVNPQAFVDSNVQGQLNVLEGCRHHPVEHLLFASTSSVYGANTNLPFSVEDNVDHPLNLYAATKKAGELMAHSYSHLFDVACTCLRFFTVYGPWGRPDMALFQFTKNIVEGKPIDVYNHGKHKRSFTYIDDIVEGIVRVLDRIPEPDPDWSGDSPRPNSSSARFRIYNIGNPDSVELGRYIGVIEECLGRKAEKNLLGLQAGDIPETAADTEDLEKLVEFTPQTTVEDGVRKFVEWYREYYGV